MSNDETPAQVSAGTTTDSTTTDSANTDAGETDEEQRQAVRRIETTPTQAVAGLRLGSGGKTPCTGCGRPIRERDAVGVCAARIGDDVRFEPARVHCRHCRRERLSHRTPGACQLVAFGRAAVTADAVTRDGQLTLRDPRVVARSASSPLRPERGP